MFSNFGIEHTHALNKRTIPTATNGFAGIDNGSSTLALQILAISRKIRAYEAAAGIDSSGRRREQTWAERNMKLFPELKHYLSANKYAQLCPGINAN